MTLSRRNFLLGTSAVVAVAAMPVPMANNEILRLGSPAWLSAIPRDFTTADIIFKVTINAHVPGLADAYGTHGL